MWGQLCLVCLYVDISPEKVWISKDCCKIMGCITECAKLFPNMTFSVPITQIPQQPRPGASSL